MYCTVLLIGRFLMDNFTKGMSPFCSGILFLDFFSFLLVADFYIFMHGLHYMKKSMPCKDHCLWSLLYDMLKNLSNDFIGLKFRYSQPSKRGLF